MKTPDPIFDHMAAVAFEAIRDPLKRTTFFRANKAAIVRECERVNRKLPLPAAPSIIAKASEPFPRGLFVKHNGQIMRCVTAPLAGLFGQSIRR
jgi:hypothetical protein